MRKSIYSPLPFVAFIGSDACIGLLEDLDLLAGLFVAVFEAFLLVILVDWYKREQLI